MITTKDAQKLAEYFKEYFKDIFATKEDLQMLEQKIDKQLTVTDKFMKEIITNRQEGTILSHDQVVIKQWMKPVSKKTNVDYPF